MLASSQRDIERIISLQFTPPCYLLIILKHFAVDCIVPLNKNYVLNSLPTPTLIIDFTFRGVILEITFY